MPETLTPNPTLLQKPRTTILSPVNSFFLGSNNDKLERAQARAARAAAIRRKTVNFNNKTDANAADKILGQQQIMELFQNCIKLASENKINQKNTWELNLIDHIFEIIDVEEANDVETNFQKASCTLEAGVKIYSMRVDSVHAEAYKVLSGIIRVGLDAEQETVEVMENGGANSAQVKQTSKKEQERKVLYSHFVSIELYVENVDESVNRSKWIQAYQLSPLSTLESSFDTLNVKKFDVAFAVDPLYHQTSAQFDEGGAKGLLLNNLGVYGGCRVLFDSLEVPGKCMSCSANIDKAETIDISHAKDSIEQMVINISKNNEISPSLKDIVNLFDENIGRPPDTYTFDKNTAEIDHEAYDNNEFYGDQHDDSGNWDFVNDNNNGPTDYGSYEREEPFMPNHHEDSDEYVSRDADVDDTFVRVDDYVFLKLGLTTRQNAWAGPDHWKYQKPKENPTKECGSPLLTKKPKNTKQAEVDIDFTKSLGYEVEDPFAPPKNLRSLLLPANREPCSTTLPEDCHYQPEGLVKLFVLPNIICLGKRGRRHSDDVHQEQVSGNFSSWDDDCGVGGQFDDGNAYSDVEDSTTLVSQPRQVEKIEVQYDRKSKQVDVHILKETLWSSMQEMHKPAQEESLSFKNMLASFQTEKTRPAAASTEDISPHLCFICLLHLANEHGLTINGSPNLDDLSIHLPSNLGSV
ncbi:hypothetical protein QVD17_27320 [Tagetes erecta]|uniref:Condensin complex subunit 2 n=1 Tax=Tagetes erecta TaxID=13708 RepID=A0AAD8KAR0_TARER|nr:hypothetical protein QVD17_27320 [Tagetes erecta]